MNREGMVFYRKYRPQKIEELDSEEIRTRLFSILSAKTVPHAFLFTGPKGLGKTSAARIVAKVLNCEKQKVEPCNKCSQCISIINGTNLDVLEIDAASNRGIDEIRDLREKIKLLPINAKKKVYIIDEVHMLTTEAFNALLKTLEEPPPHAVFILCTTEPQKVPATIVSRCVHIPFRRASKDELIRSFTRIAKDEKLPIEKEALIHLASLSDGSFRDGVKMLEELVLVSDSKKITKELMEEKYRVSNIKSQVSKMIEFLETKDTKGALELVWELIKQGFEMKFFMEKMIDELHFQILKNIGIKVADLDYETVSGFTIEELKSLIELLTRAYGEIKYAVLPQLPLELVIIEWGGLQSDVRLSRVENEEENVRLTHAARDARGPYQQDQSRTRSLSESRHQAKTNLKGKSQATFSSLAGGQVHTNNIWQELIEKVKSYNHSVAGVLRGCSLKSFDGKKLIIETGYKFHKERLEEGKTRDILRKVLEEIGNKDAIIEIALITK